MDITYLSGNPVKIGPRLGAGGEGEVFAVDDQSAMKIYSSPPTEEKIKKLQALIDIRNSELLNIAAWPKEIVCDKLKRPIGFVMPILDGHVPFTELTHPKVRKKNHPGCKWDFLVHASRNLAAAMQTVHKAGVVIGDVNDLNVFIDPKTAVVKLIDVDSFQVSAGGKFFSTGVGVPMFLPPELQCVSLEHIERTKNHDVFSLGIVIFQALMVGRHPFVGIGQIGDRELPEMIRDLPFAYGDDAKKQGINIPPNSLEIDVLSRDLQNLFNLTFCRGVRPSPKDWAAALDTFKQQLIQCGTNSSHVYGNHNTVCPWCSLERHGVVMFFNASKSLHKENTFNKSDTTGILQIKIWLETLPVLNESLPIDPNILIETATLPKVPQSIVESITYWASIVLCVLIIGALWKSQQPTLCFLGTVLTWFLATNLKTKDAKSLARMERQLMLNYAEQEWKDQSEIWLNQGEAIKIIKRKKERAERLIATILDQEGEWKRQVSMLEANKRDLQFGRIFGKIRYFFSSEEG